MLVIALLGLATRIFRAGGRSLKRSAVVEVIHDHDDNRRTI